MMRDTTAGWRVVRAAAWLGWQIESNWTRPLVFALYSVVKPLAMAGIVVMMYAVITRSDFGSPVFAYVYLGNAFWVYVGAVTTGMAYAVVDDRERYKMLKAVSVAPTDLRWYLVGRGAARFLGASISVLVTIGIGVFVLHLPLRLASVDWGLLAAVFAVGTAMLAALGLILAGAMLLLAHQSWSVGEALAGALFLFSGALFPLTVLPAPVRPIGYALPVMYWIELVRRALVGSLASAFPDLSGRSNLELLGIFLALTAALVGVAVAAFDWCEAEARERGLLDWTTNY
jgi:ABC-2 type transport system permease protein